jgi:hypothetical protein
MTTPILARLGAACGAIFALTLVVAGGDGEFSAVGAVLGLSALVVALPFICYLTSVLRDADLGNRWLADTALAGGLVGITLKIASGTAELAIYRVGVAKDTELHKVLTAMSDGATVACLYPLALLCAASAVIALRTHALPTWLGVGAAVTAGALAVNGAFLKSSFVPALLLFALWMLLASVHLIRATSPRRTVRAATVAAA